MNPNEVKDFPKNAIAYSALAIAGFGILYYFNLPTLIVLPLLVGETIAIVGAAQSIRTAIDSHLDDKAEKDMAKRFKNK